MEAISIASSLVSLVLAILAIWLSVVFYRMSNESSTKIHEASKDVAASVTRLEKLFDRLYSDTFSMMKDTVTDMRHQLWPERNDETAIELDVEKKADAKVQQIRDEVNREIAALTQRVGGTNERVADLQAELQSVVDGAISKSRHVESEAKEETLREAILKQYRELTRSGKPVTAGELVNTTADSTQFDMSSVVHEVFNLRRDGVLKHEGPTMSPRTVVTLSP